MSSVQQHPIPSGYGPHTTAREVLGGKDLSGRTYVVTGGYAGLGLETTRVLAEAGAQVVVPVRSPEKARRNLAGVPRVELQPMDLLEPAAIDAFARQLGDRPLHGLVNNAGIMAPPLGRDARGYEQQLAANHLGHFQLTVRLWPALARAGGARIVALSSRGHHRAPVDFHDPNFEHRPYDPWAAYGQSKTANVLFAVGADARGQQAGIRAFALHPGGILTELAQHMSDAELAAMGVHRQPDGTVDDREFRKNGGKTVEEGAATTVWCLTSEQLDGLGGLYCEDCDVAALAPEGVRTGVREYAIDPALAERLWTLSEQLTGARLD